jgi:hypothetical protein
LLEYFKKFKSLEDSAMEVRVVRAQSIGACPETDYVRVHTYSDPLDDTITLATIERVVEKANAAATRQPNAPKRVKTLVTRAPMSPSDALVLATSYAERKKIPVVYADPSEPETATPNQSAR